jgi:hypothetical protein
MEEQIPKLDLTPISASRVKTFENCSWLYYCKYDQKIPEPTNEGALKGSVCHDVLELLILPKHSSKVKEIQKAGTIMACASVAILVRKLIKKYRLPPHVEIFNLINDMLVVALNADFKVKGGTLIKPEYEFNIVNQDPVYCIKGFIDKPFKKGKKVIIDDYKSSKKKFEGEDVDSNLQALIYSLACLKIWPELEPEVRFIFLQFPDDPIVKAKFTREQLRGLEYYLADIQKKLDSFCLDHAYKNLAANQGMPTTGEFKGRLLCGFAKEPGQLKKDGTKMWHCPMKFPFKYWAVKRNGKVIKTHLKLEDAKPKDEDVVEECYYEGCPAYRNVVSDLPDAPVRAKTTPVNVLDDF